MVKPPECKTHETSDSSRNGLMLNLLKLVDLLVQIALPGRNQNNPGNSAGASGTDSSRRGPAGSVSSVDLDTEMAGGGVLDLDSSLPDSSKISQGLTGTGPLMSSTPTSTVPPQSDDEKQNRAAGNVGVATDEEKTESNAAAAAAAAAAAGLSSNSTITVSASGVTNIAIGDPPPSCSSGSAAAARPRTPSCSHFADSRHPDAERKDPSLADIILAHPGIMHNLLQALSCCNSNAMAMMLSSSGIPDVMQDSFFTIDPVSVGDGVFKILCTLNKKTSDVKLILKPVLQYMSSGSLV